MSGYLTTHVLDIARGLPAVGLKITLRRLFAESALPLTEMLTNADGRTDRPILPQESFEPGRYELVFHAGAYLRDLGVALTEPPFLDEIPIRFGMRAGHYHVPLLLSPYGYSTYRGS